MPLNTLFPVHTTIRLADMADVAAFVCGSFPSSRKQPFFAGGSSPRTRGICGMAAANTVFPAAKSANHPSSRRQLPQTRANHARSRRQ